jgi:Flp pilus assembly protein TadD
MPSVLRCLLLPLTLLTATMVVGCDIPNRVHRLRGLNHYERAELDEAASDFEAAVDRDPTDWRGHYYLGRIALDRGRPSPARRHFEIAYTLRQRPDPLQIDAADPEAETDPEGRWPSMSQIVDGLAESIYQAGDEAQLFAFLDEVIDRHARPVDYLRKADYLSRTGDHDGAVTAYRQAIAVEPADPDLYLALAEFYDQLGRRDDALTELRHAYYLAPDDREVAERIRAHGVVPGPTIALPPPQLAD